MNSAYIEDIYKGRIVELVELTHSKEELDTQLYFELCKSLSKKDLKELKSFNEGDTGYNELLNVAVRAYINKVLLKEVCSSRGIDFKDLEELTGDLELELEDAFWRFDEDEVIEAIRDEVDSKFSKITTIETLRDCYGYDWISSCLSWMADFYQMDENKINIRITTDEFDNRFVVFRRYYGWDGIIESAVTYYPEEAWYRGACGNT